MKKKSASKKIWAAVAITILVAIFIRVFAGEPCHISSSSMEPTIQIGDWLWINKSKYGGILPSRWSDIPVINIFTWNKTLYQKDLAQDWGYRRTPGFGDVQINDIIVFRSPENKRVLLVKRVKYWLAAGSALHVNASNYEHWQRIASQEGVTIQRIENKFFIGGQPADSFHLKYGYGFVLGDNAAISRDSRFFGYICEKDIVGKVNSVIFSTKSLNRLFMSID